MRKDPEQTVTDPRSYRDRVRDAEGGNEQGHSDAPGEDAVRETKLTSDGQKKQFFVPKEALAKFARA